MLLLGLGDLGRILHRLGQLGSNVDGLRAGSERDGRGRVGGVLSDRQGGVSGSGSVLGVSERGGGGVGRVREGGGSLQLDGGRGGIGGIGRDRLRDRVGRVGSGHPESVQCVGGVGDGLELVLRIQIAVGTAGDAIERLGLRLGRQSSVVSIRVLAELVLGVVLAVQFGRPGRNVRGGGQRRSGRVQRRLMGVRCVQRGRGRSSGNGQQGRHYDEQLHI
uniref:Uncharacterized protein n=1 Tax=Anopheles melas TaxID=34690 RepID=A0A182TT16_9DIPT